MSQVKELNYNFQDLDSDNMADLQHSSAIGEMHGIVSESEGGIIAYAIGYEHADLITAKLNESDQLTSLINGMNWDLLRAQKTVLLDAMAKTKINKTEANALDGVIHLIDAIQDMAVDLFGKEKDEVFNYANGKDYTVPLDECKRIVNESAE